MGKILDVFELMISRSIDNQENIDISELTIRPARYEDLRELTEVLVYGFYQFPQPLSWIYSLIKLGIYEDLKSRLLSPSPFYCCLIAVSTDSQGKKTIVGTVEIAVRYPSVWSLDSQYTYISNLVVKPNYRRQGVGKKLLAECEQIASSWGYYTIFLHVLKSNEGAKRLYIEKGYRLDRSESSWSDLFLFPSQRLLLSKQI